jgi:hypothetical protein
MMGGQIHLGARACGPVMCNSFGGFGQDGGRAGRSRSQVWHKSQR